MASSVGVPGFFRQLRKDGHLERINAGQGTEVFGGEASHSNSYFTVSTGIDRSVLTRYRESLPTETIAYLEQHCLPDLYWHAPPSLEAPAR